MRLFNISKLTIAILTFLNCFSPIAIGSKTTKTADNKSVNELIILSGKKFDAGSYQEAIGVALKALSVAEKNNNGLELSRANFQVGKMLYFNQEPYENILQYFKKARHYIYSNHIDSLKQNINYNIGVIYIEQNAGDSAKFYLKKVFEEKNAMNNSAIVSKTFSVLADYYLVQNLNLPLAKLYIEKAEKHAALTNDYRVKTFAQLKKGIYYSLMKQYDNSLTCFNKAKVIYETHGDVEDRMYVYKLIALIKASKANLDITNAFLQYLNLKDSLFRVESAKKTAQYKVLYETEKKDREISLKTAEAENQKNKNRIQMLLFGGLIMIISFLSFFLFYRQKNLQKANLLMETNRLERLRYKAVIESEEKERKRIARELHDGLGQLLSTAKMNVASLDDAVNQSDEEDKIIYQTSLNLIDEAVAEVRLISHNLMPGTLIRLGLIPALQDLVKKINTSGKIKVDFEPDPDFEKLSETSEIAIFRIVQEVLNNSLKHSGAKSIGIALKKLTNEIRLTITDDGIGIDVSMIEKSEGIGWKNIYSRVAMLNGKIEIQSQKDTGTTILISLKNM